MNRLDAELAAVTEYVATHPGATVADVATSGLYKATRAQDEAKAAKHWADRCTCELWRLGILVTGPNAQPREPSTERPRRFWVWRSEAR